MKKLKNYYFALMAIASLSFMTSCGGDDEPNPRPTIGLSPDATAITAAPGEQLNVKVQVTSADKLKEFKVIKTTSTTSGSQEVVKTTNFSGSGHEYTLNETIPTTASDNSTITYTITATTNEDETAERTITVTVKSMDTFTAKIMGNQNSSTGSFFSSKDGRVLNSTDAKANSALVDLVFYHSSPTSGDPVAATNAATIAAPTDPKAEQIFNNANTGLTTWTTQNNTELKLLGSGSTATALFDAATTGQQIADAYMASTATAGTFVNKLKANDVFGFMTAGGKHGVAKVISVTTNATPSFTSEIRLDVKVQR